MAKTLRSSTKCGQNERSSYPHVRQTSNLQAPDPQSKQGRQRPGKNMARCSPDKSVVKRHPSQFSKSDSLPLSKRSSKNTNYLINITISNDWTPCHSLPTNQSSTLITIYHFGEGVLVQCLEGKKGEPLPLWRFMQDFCYVVETSLKEGFVEGEFVQFFESVFRYYH